MWLIPFNIMCPLLIMVGALLADKPEPWVQLVFMAMATGTFLYVGGTEVVCEEFGRVCGAGKLGVVATKVLKFGALFAGFLFIFPGIFIPKAN